MRVPFTNLPGDLDPVTKSAIQRNFQEIENKLISGAGGFDATIDPAATNNKATHTYANLAGLVSGETGWTINRQMVVRVVGRPGQMTIDPAPVAFPGPLTLVGEGGMGVYEDNADVQNLSPDRQSRPMMDVRGQLSGSVAITLNNVTILNNGGSSLSQLFANGTTLYMFHAHILGCDAAVTAQFINSLGGAALYGYDSSFWGIFPQAAAGNSYLSSCNFIPGFRTSDALSSSQHMYWDGGIFGVYASAAYTLNITGGVHYLKFAGGNANYTSLGSVNGGFANRMTLAVTGGNAYIDTYDVFASVTVASSFGNLRMSGRYGQLTCNGNNGGVFSLPNERAFNVTLTGAGAAPTADLTGPLDAVLNFTEGIGLHQQVIVRGSNTNVRGNIIADTSPALKLVGAVECSVVANITFVGGTTQAYSIDAASSHNLLVLGGAADPNFSTPSTDAGTNNRVITSDSDTWVSGPGLASQINVTFGRPTPLPEPIPSEAEMEPWWMPVGSTGGGAAGAPGAQGPAGPQGAMAPQLAAEEPEEPWWFPVGFQKGDTGPQGPQGVPGTGGSGGAAAPLADPTRSEDFEQWWQPVGPQVGATGSQGVQGTQGPQGSKGDVILPDPTDDNAEPWWIMPGPGPQGQVGAQGVQGQQGVQGPAGSAPLPDTVDDNAEPWWLIPGPLAGPVGPQGPQGIPGTGGGGGGTAQPLAVEYDTDEPWWLPAGTTPPPKDLLDEFLLHAAR